MKTILTEVGMSKMGLKESLFGKVDNLGLNGVSNGMVVVNGSLDENRGCGGMLGDAIMVPPTALLGAGILLAARGAKKVTDVFDPSTETIFDSKAKKEKKKELRRKKEEAKKTETSWTDTVESVIGGFLGLRNNPNRTVSIATGIIGKKTLETIDNTFMVNQKTPVEIKPVQEEELSFAQRILGEIEPGEDVTQKVRRSILDMAMNNIQKTVGGTTIDSLERKKLEDIKQKTDITVTHVGFWEGFVAGMLGVKGNQAGSVRGGYTVKINENGMMKVGIGQDYNTLAPAGEIAPDRDIPVLYETAMSVAKEQSPVLFFKKQLGWLVKGMIGMNKRGEAELIPGTVMVGNINNEDVSVFPAMNAEKHIKRINEAVSAGRKLNQRIRELDHVAIVPEEELRERIVDESLKGVQKIPRESVVLKLIGGINPDILNQAPQPSNPSPGQPSAPETVINLPESQSPETSKRRSTRKKQEVTPIKKSQTELDLERMGLSNMDQRKALMIKKHPREVFEKLKREFGATEARRLLANAVKKSNEILGL